jgi:hypothetical protein
VVWPTPAPKAAARPVRHTQTVMETMLLTTVPALLAVAVLRPGSNTYRRNR